MLLEIILKDFKIFGGVHAFRFSSDPDRPITTFSTITASGKTTFLEAIWWCMYGSLHSIMRPIINIETEAQMNDGDQELVYVQIAIKHNDTITMLRRECIYQKNVRGCSERGTRFLLNNSLVTQIEFMKAVEKILPKYQAKAFFWSDELYDPSFIFTIERDIKRHYHFRLEMIFKRLNIDEDIWLENLFGKVTQSASDILGAMIGENYNHSIVRRNKKVAVKTNDNVLDVNQLPRSGMFFCNVAYCLAICQGILNSGKQEKCPFPVIIDGCLDPMLQADILLNYLTKEPIAHQLVVLLHYTTLAQYQHSLQQQIGLSYEMNHNIDHTNVTAKEIIATEA